MLEENRIPEVVQVTWPIVKQVVDEIARKQKKPVECAAFVLEKVKEYFPSTVAVPVKTTIELRRSFYHRREIEKIIQAGYVDLAKHLQSIICETLGAISTLSVELFEAREALEAEKARNVISQAVGHLADRPDENELQTANPDDPTCAACGSAMEPEGSCYKCPNCGERSGCS